MMYQEVNQVVALLRSGGTILYPTDTVWGIGCMATDAAAVRKVYEIKQRDDAKSLIILLPEAKDVFKYTAQPHPDVIHMLQQFERPTTVIYTHAIGLPDNLVHQDGSIAIRVTKDPFCKMLLKRLQQPIVSTSANISGLPTPSSFQDIDPVIRQRVDYVVNWRQEEQRPATPSRIVRLTDQGNIEVIRG